MKKGILLIICSFFYVPAFCQIPFDSTIISVPIKPDTVLRIKNLNPYFAIHVDSTLNYKLEINKNIKDYYWFLKNAPVGLKINKDNGLLTFKVEKSYFLSGKLKYDKEYKVDLSVQNLDFPEDKGDTSFRLMFYSTEIIPSKLKPTVTETMYVDEGDTVSFKIQCDNGSFPIENINYISNFPIKSSSAIANCGDDFTWAVPFDFIKPGDKEKTKKVSIHFIGSTKFHTSDTTVIQIIVKENINYPQQEQEFDMLRSEIALYITSLKSSFRVVDRKIKRTKGTRTVFDLASASTALGGTIFSSIPETKGQSIGKILPSVGVALVPVKEATAPNSSYEQNTASQIRSSIKRLEYLMSQNKLVGDRDPDILIKFRKLGDELKQTQVQLIDIPLAEEAPNKKELDKYFNSEKVNKKYKLKK